ncbi:MAG: hypothetical protein E7418_02150 [Ruminococcaceae bacterium]|nr:hypothetical protein [Oscillospiraceae bacterium]
MKFSFNEDARCDLANYFDEGITGLREASMALFESFTEIYQREQYKKLHEVTNVLIERYGEDLRNTIFQQYENWLSSDASLQAFAEDLEAGSDSSDDAIVAAESLEAEIEDILTANFDLLPDVTPVTEEGGIQTKSSEELFEELEDLLRVYGNTIDSDISTYESLAENNSDDNQLYLNVASLLIPIMNTYKVFFESFVNAFDTLEEELETSADQQTTKADEAKQDLKAAGESAVEAQTF